MSIQELRDEIAGIDAEMAQLFERRMELAGRIAEYKREHGLPVEDTRQEKLVKDRGCACIENDSIRPYYAEFIRELMEISKQWQRSQ